MRTIGLAIGTFGVLWACARSPDLLDHLIEGKPTPLVRERVRGTIAFMPPDAPLPPVLQDVDQRVQAHASDLLRRMETETGVPLKGTLQRSAWARLSPRRFLLRYFAPGNHPLYAGVALALVVQAPSGRIERIHLYPVPLE